MLKFLKKVIFSFFFFVRACLNLPYYFFLWFFKIFRIFTNYDRWLGEKFYFKFYKKYPKLVNFVFVTSEKWKEDRFFSWTLLFGFLFGLLIFKVYFHYLLPSLWNFLIQYYNKWYFLWFFKQWTKKVKFTHKYWLFQAAQYCDKLALKRLLKQHWTSLEWFGIIFTTFYFYLCQYAKIFKYYFLIVCYCIFMIFFCISFMSLLFFFFFNESYYAYHVLIIDEIYYIAYVERWLWINFINFCYLWFSTYYYYNYYLTQIMLYIGLAVLIIFVFETFYYYYSRLYTIAIKFADSFIAEQFEEDLWELDLYYSKDFLDYYD